MIQYSRSIDSYYISPLSQRSVNWAALADLFMFALLQIFCLAFFRAVKGTLAPGTLAEQRASFRLDLVTELAVLFGSVGMPHFRYALAGTFLVHINHLVHYEFARWVTANWSNKEHDWLIDWSVRTPTGTSEECLGRLPASASAKGDGVAEKKA